MKKLLTIALILYTYSVSGQVYSSEGLYYSGSKTPYQPPPTNEVISAMNQSQETYLKNRKICNELEDILINELKSLKIENRNIHFKKEINQILEELKEIRATSSYSSSTLDIQDLVRKAENAYTYYYEDEDEIRREELKRENERLRQELEYQKQLNKNN